VRPAQAGRGRQVIIARQVHSLALDRLDHERGDVAAAERLLQRVQVIEWNLRAGADERPEALAKKLVAAQRQGAVGQAVERVLAVQDFRAAGRGTAELDRRLHRFGPGIAEQQLLQPGHVTA
jgi:hypothetical protein